MGTGDDKKPSSYGGHEFHQDDVDDFVDRLIEGNLAEENGLSPLKEALIEISSFSASEISISGSSVVEQMAAEIIEARADLGLQKQVGYFTRLIGAKAFLVATTAAAFTGTAAAAFSGNLPAPIQNVFSAAASNIGVSLPVVQNASDSQVGAKGRSHKNKSNGNGILSSSGSGSLNAMGTTSTTGVTNAPSSTSVGHSVTDCVSSTKDGTLSALSFVSLSALLDSTVSQTASTTTTSSVTTSTTTTSSTTTTEPPTTTQPSSAGITPCPTTTTASPTTTTKPSSTTTTSPTTTTTTEPPTTTTTSSSTTTTTTTTAAPTPSAISDSVGGVKSPG